VLLEAPTTCCPRRFQSRAGAGSVAPGRRSKHTSDASAKLAGALAGHFAQLLAGVAQDRGDAVSGFAAGEGVPPWRGDMPASRRASSSRRRDSASGSSIRLLEKAGLAAVRAARGRGDSASQTPLVAGPRRKSTRAARACTKRTLPPAPQRVPTRRAQTRRLRQRSCRCPHRPHWVTGPRRRP
jgi:hypothetical protein